MDCSEQELIVTNNVLALSLANTQDAWPAIELMNELAREASER